MIHRLYEYVDSDLRIHHAIDEFPEDKDYPMHAHEWCEILGFIRGKGDYTIEGNVYRLEPGCILIMRPAETHKLHIDSSEPYERIMVNFPTTLIEKIDPSKKLLQSFIDRPLGQLNLYRNQEFTTISGITYLREMVSVAYTREDQRLNIITNLLPLLNAIKNIFIFKKTFEMNLSNRNTSQLIIDYINVHLHEELSLEVLSRQFFLSKSQISRLIKKATGCSVLDYITIKRLMRAREYILSGETATNASRLCGFNNYSSFYRAYVKHFPELPSDLKK